ncbi:chordin-like protein 1 [Trichonephila clavata]|uniref:Chordin-like protein 1 n=1 Tax=Trichonephila clavata TaxID=2740835 RepID=A0A8X6JMX7_TRICU|nr:chordin-like protein 1 [Trichonephila clavata]
MSSIPAASSIHGISYIMVICQHSSAYVPQILLILLFGLATSLGAPPSALTAVETSKSSCSFSDQEYRVNQTWYKYLRTPNLIACVLCTCKSDAPFGNVVNCSNITCSRTLCEGTKRDECCDECYDAEVSEKVSELKSGALQAEVQSAKFPCLHNGRVYQDGEEFSSNATDLQAQKPNQCIHCICKTGLVLCRLKNCDSLHCFSSDTKECCPSCKDEILPSEQASLSNPVLVTIMISDSQSQRGDCIAAGVTYSHGSSWHPVIGPFGPMDCVYCKCQNGKIECSRLNCPPLQTLSCSKPIQVPGHCCPICAEKAPEVLEKDIEPSLSQPPISVTMEHKGTRQIPDSKKSSEPMVNCLPPQTNTVVFRSHASSSSSAYYQYAFQSVNGDQSTRLLTWTVKDGRIGDFSEQHLSKEEFKALMGTFQFKLQGATRTKFMEKFIRKAKRLPDRCGGRCATKIQHLGQVLHLREVLQRQQCLAQETSFHQ